MHECEGRRRDVEVSLAIVAYESNPSLAAQDLGELDPRGLQVAQPLGGPPHPVLIDRLPSFFSHMPAL